MSRKKRKAIALGLTETLPTVESVTTEKSFWRSLGKIERYFAVGIIALLAVGVFGAVSSNLNLFGGSSSANSTAQNSVTPDSATPNSKTQNSTSSQPISPTNPPPPTSATPQLSKEYVYAGSRMLAVEDANANATPPADLAVWRPTTGTWYVLGGVPGSSQVGYGWGMNGDIPAPGDYDGDGKTDFSIARPGTSGNSGVWWIMYSSTNTYTSIPFGLICPPPATCDKLAQADYDGDGKTDPAVFRSSDGTWYILPSSGGSSYYGVQFGLGTDLPAPADYDGDGKADIAVWRNSATIFYSSNSSNGATSYVNMNQSGGEPVSGDYDGDGRADYAIRNENNWIIKKSSDGTVETVAWQMATDKAVQNDYDGDGKVDVAVWRPTNSSLNINDAGTWYIKQSSSNTPRIVQWGMNGDIPVPAFYRR
jgi:FG-GAP-like repeat